jgi:hypothetical protein
MLVWKTAMGVPKTIREELLTGDCEVSVGVERDVVAVD